MRIPSVVMASLILSVAAFAGTPIKVGVFNSEIAGGRGKTYEKVYANLQAFKDFKVEYFHPLTVDGMEKFDVVVFVCVQKAGEQKEDWKSNIRSYVEVGGSIVLGHDSCGFAHDFSPSLFPEVETTIRREPATAISLTDAGKAIAPDVKSPFKSCWIDMVVMKPGANATVLAKSSDGEAVAVMGNADMGKVVAIGTLAGGDAAAKDELAFLADCLRAVAKKDASGGAAATDATLRALKKEVIFLKKRVEKLEKETQRIDEDTYNEIQFLKHGGTK